MKKPKSVALIGTCPHCGEAVEMIISKAEVKHIFKGFKLPIKQAQLYGEKKIEIRKR
jgi:hypothetical protein